MFWGDIFRLTLYSCSKYNDLIIFSTETVLFNAWRIEPNFLQRVFSEEIFKALHRFMQENFVCKRS